MITAPTSAAPDWARWLDSMEGVPEYPPPAPPKQPGRYARVTRALAFAPYADLLWLETATPDLAEARAFADIIYSQYPGKPLAYSCSPAFEWADLDQAEIATFQGALAALGYRLQDGPEDPKLLAWRGTSTSIRPTRSSGRSARSPRSCARTG